MQASDFEIVIDCVTKRPGLTGREVATTLRRNGHERFTSKMANQILYRLLATSMVARDGSGDKPRWYPPEGPKSHGSANTKNAKTKRPLNTEITNVKKYRVASTEVRLLLDESMSSNDPYETVDWVGSHVVVSVNVQHPFWNIRLGGSTDRALFCMFAAVDAYVQWKVAQLHEPPNATEIQKLRDHALRFCSLLEAEHN